MKDFYFGFISGFLAILLVVAVSVIGSCEKDDKTCGNEKISILYVAKNGIDGAKASKIAEFAKTIDTNAWTKTSFYEGRSRVEIKLSK